MKEDVLFTLVGNARRYVVPGFLGISVITGAAGHVPTECDPKAVCDWAATLERHPDDVHSTASGTAVLQGYGQLAVTIPSTAAPLKNSIGFTADVFGVRYFDVGGRTFRVSFDLGGRSA